MLRKPLVSGHNLESLSFPATTLKTSHYRLLPWNPLSIGTCFESSHYRPWPQKPPFTVPAFLKPLVIGPYLQCLSLPVFSWGKNVYRFLVWKPLVTASYLGILSSPVLSLEDSYWRSLLWKASHHWSLLWKHFITGLDLEIFFLSTDPYTGSLLLPVFTLEASYYRLIAGPFFRSLFVTGHCFENPLIGGLYFKSLSKQAHPLEASHYRHWFWKPLVRTASYSESFLISVLALKASRYSLVTGRLLANRAPKYYGCLKQHVHGSIFPAWTARLRPTRTQRHTGPHNNTSALPLAKHERQ